MFVLNLGPDGRILSVATDLPTVIGPRVEELPEGYILDYRYKVDEDGIGSYIHDPLPKASEEPPVPTQLDMIEAQVMYTALMTDTLIETEVE